MPTLMKAHTWKDHSHKMTYPCVAEAKMDEVRVEVIRRPWGIEYISYAGNPFYNLSRFDLGFQKLFNYFQLDRLDCGFEVNGNFKDSNRWTKQKNGLSPDLVAVEHTCKFYLFANPDSKETFAIEQFRLDNYALYARTYNLPLERPIFYNCHTPDDVEEAYLFFREKGFEGAVVKTLDHIYEPKRSYSWLKMKPEETADGKIVAILEAICGKDQPHLGLKVGDKLGRAGSLMLELEDGSVACVHGIPYDLGSDMLRHPELYLSEWVEFKYMMRASDGGYRHPVFIRLRDAK